MFHGQQELLQQRRRMNLPQRSALGDVVVKLTAPNPLSDQVDPSQSLNHLEKPLEKIYINNSNPIKNSVKDLPQNIWMMNTLESGYFAGQHAQGLGIETRSIQVHHLNGHFV